MDSIAAVIVAFGLALLSRNLVQTGSLATASVVVAGFLATRYLSKRGFQAPLPPGPSGWPIIGNVLQIPQTRPWLTYSKWAGIYGDIIHLEALGEHLIVLNSVTAAQDLLDKRSSIYSDRPHLVMADLSGFGIELPLRHYDDAWRAQRKIVVQSFNQSLVPRYYHIQELEACKLVQGILENPSSLVSETKVRIAAIIMRVTYGYRVKGANDRMITMPFEGMDNFSLAAEPGTWMVDFVPQLKFLPEWTPGATFLRTAKRWRQLEWDASWNPYLWCKRNLETGLAETPSLCSTVLSQAEGKMSCEDEATLVWAASSGLGGGLDTNMSTIFTFILAMLHHPDVQAKAQAELDAVVGPDRLPAITDRPSLPYVRSLIAEVYRWNPAVPLCLPHASTQDDIYNGVFLPKGSIFMPNVWHMLHDPEVYTDPMEFKPERFHGEDAEMQKVTDLAFGFGRRTCPGYQFAEGTIFAIVSTLLATSSVVPAMDSKGKAIIPDIAYTSGTIIFPENIVCDLKPRSPHAKTMLMHAVAGAE